MPSVDLKVVTLCAYLTDIDKPWRNDDYRCTKMVKALKGQPIKGTLSVAVGGQQQEFSQANVADFVKLIAPKMAEVVKANFTGDFCLVPIPNSQVTSPDSPDFKTLKLAKDIGAATGNPVVPCLTFSTAQTPSHKGGPRDPYYFESVMTLGKRLPKKGVILVDDVFTSGSHIQGAAWKLMSAGVNVIGAITFGRTTKEQEEKPFSVALHALSLSKRLFDFQNTF